LDHGEEVVGQLVVANGNAAEMLQPGEEALDEVALAIEPLAEARLPLAIRFCGDIGRGALFLDLCADAISIVCLVCENDRMRSRMAERLDQAPLEVGQVISAHAEPESDSAAI
jgi:hypothetical protein